MEFQDLNKKLADLRFNTSHFYFATNTIGFQFFDTDKKIIARLIIDPQWRIIQNDTLINSSLDCPWHEDYESQQEYKNDFNSWCGSTEYLKGLQIKSIRIINNLGDLEIIWSDGSMLQTFISYDKEEYWYLESENDFARYIVETGKVTIEQIKPKKND